jgi:hypothetical protein
VYIQYRCQHLITTTIQNLLEESCFEFAQQHFPRILASKGWDCHEAVELTAWTRLISQHPPQPAKGINKPIDELFGHLHELRHSAVHRLRKAANSTVRCESDATRTLLDTLFGSIAKNLAQIIYYGCHHTEFSSAAIAHQQYSNYQLYPTSKP